MKRAMLAALVLGLVPMAAWADSISFIDLSGFPQGPSLNFANGATSVTATGTLTQSGTTTGTNVYQSQYGLGVVGDSGLPTYIDNLSRHHLRPRNFKTDIFVDGDAELG